jgi:SAM-dependent methyltransferase
MSSKQFQNAISLHLRNDFQSALEIYNEILTFDPDNPDALHLIGLVLLQNGFSSQGYLYIQRALEISPKCHEARHNLQALSNSIIGRYSLEETVIGGIGEALPERKLGSVGDWRHLRMLEFARYLHGQESSWLTIGDHFGHDAERLASLGIERPTPSSLSVNFLEIAESLGRFEEVLTINAESIDLEDCSFDYVLCKEALHHMPRPYLAIYEMLRVAKKAVIFIEPLDPVIDWRPENAVSKVFRRFLTNDNVGEKVVYSNGDGKEITSRYIDWWEDDAKNYVYTFSEREITKLAQGYGLPSFAIRTFNDIYLAEHSDDCANHGSIGFDKTLEQIQLHDVFCNATGIPKAYITSILFKNTPEPAVASKLREVGFDFRVTRTQYLPLRWPDFTKN